MTLTRSPEELNPNTVAGREMGLDLYENLLIFGAGNGSHPPFSAVIGVGLGEPIHDEAERVFSEKIGIEPVSLGDRCYLGVEEQLETKLGYTILRVVSQYEDFPAATISYKVQ